MIKQTKLQKNIPFLYDNFLSLSIQFGASFSELN